MAAAKAFQSTSSSRAVMSSSSNELRMSVMVLSHCLLLCGLSVALGLCLRVMWCCSSATIFASVVK